MPESERAPEDCLEKEPTNVDYLMLQAELMMEIGDKEGAEKILDTSTYEGEGSARVHQHRHQQDQLRRQGAGRAGGRVVDQADRAVPQRAMLLYLRGGVHRRDQVAEAKATWRNMSRRRRRPRRQMADAKKLLDQLNKK